MSQTDPRFTEGPDSRTIVGGTSENVTSEENEAVSGDTGLKFGIGQSTSTGTLPTQGGANMDGTTTVFETVENPEQDLQAHSSMDYDNIDQTELEALARNPDPMKLVDHDPEVINVPLDDRERLVDTEEHRTPND